MTESEDTHEVVYRGERVSCTEDNYEFACEQLIEKMGPPTDGDHPRIRPISCCRKPSVRSED